MAFIGATTFSIQGGAYNHVEGDQIIHNTNQTVCYRQIKEECTVYDEFYNIKLGAIYILKDIHHEDYPRRWDIGIRERWEEGQFRVDKRISTAKLHDCGLGVMGMTFLAVSYAGPQAMKAWEKDFEEFSQVRDAQNIQLFGINQSRLPMLIFHGELLPVEHVWDKVTTLGRSYIYTLTRNMECYEYRLWIDTSHGTLVRGLDGPICGGGYALGITDLPSGLEFLEDKVFWRYLSRLPLDRELDTRVLRMLEWMSTKEELETSLGKKLSTMSINRPIVISAETNSVVAVGNTVWRVGTWETCLQNEVLLLDGTRRYELVERGDDVLKIKLFSSFSADIRAWLSQASSVFHQLGVLPSDTLSYFKLIVPELWAKAKLENCEIKRQRRMGASPIYFFLSLVPVDVSPSPLPSVDSSSSTAPAPFHFWSLDPAGHARISNKYCEYLGLPTRLNVKVGLHFQHCWATKTYRDLERWQRDRGFDPTTGEFGAYLGFPVFTVME